MRLMLLCAGQGTRLRPYTETTPKPLIPFMGTPMVCYSLQLADELPISKIVFNTHHLGNKVEDFFKSLKFRNLPVAPFYEQTLLGSGGGINNAKSAIIGGGDFIVMNGDEVILPEQFGVMREMLSFHKYHKGIATLLTVDHPEVGAKFGGAWVDSNQKVKCFSKKNPGDSNLKGEHFVGVMILSDRVFKYFKGQVQDENILYETLTAAIASFEEVYTYKCKAIWHETGNPKDFTEATEFCVTAVEKDQTKQEYWVNYLQQVMRLSPRLHPVIENTTIGLSERVLKIQKAL